MLLRHPHYLPPPNGAPPAPSPASGAPDPPSAWSAPFVAPRLYRTCFVFAVTVKLKTSFGICALRFIADLRQECRRSFFAQQLPSPLLRPPTKAGCLLGALPPRRGFHMFPPRAASAIMDPSLLVLLNLDFH